MKKKKIIFLIAVLLILGFVGQWISKNYNFNSKYVVGQKIDSLNGVYVFYNGGVANSKGRNLTSDGYNLGMKYQCVEFVKRYYFEYLKHKMPDSYGNAKDFFDNKLSDGQLNEKRNLNQYGNPSKSPPKNNDILIFNENIFNTYGHVAIISNVCSNEIEIIQQNAGTCGKSRIKIHMEQKNGKWKLKSERILGWLTQLEQKK